MGLGFTLKPNGFVDGNPALDLRQLEGTCRHTNGSAATNDSAQWTRELRNRQAHDGDTAGRRCSAAWSRGAEAASAVSPIAGSGPGLTARQPTREEQTLQSSPTCLATPGSDLPASAASAGSEHAQRERQAEIAAWDRCQPWDEAMPIDPYSPRARRVYAPRPDVLTLARRGAAGG